MGVGLRVFCGYCRWGAASLLHMRVVPGCRPAAAESCDGNHMPAKPEVPAAWPFLQEVCQTPAA